LLFAIPVARQCTRTALDSIGLWRLPTALITSEARVKDVFATIGNTLTLASQINWLALEDNAPLPAECGKNVRLLPIGDPNELALTLYREGCSQAVVATSDMQSEHFANLVQRLMELGIAVSMIPSFRRLPLVGARTSYFFGKDILLIEMRSSVRGLPSRFVKRAFDIVGSLGLIVLFSPFFLIISAAIKLHDRGPIFYTQRRTGRNGAQFGCLKFRTMATDADARLERWQLENPALYEEFLKSYKLPDDPRITAPGKWLRQSSLDELPQLFNVLIGEMSLVGPRPIPEAQLTAQYGPAERLYKSVRPGLTGLWQISGRNNTSLEERVNYDEWYILNWTFWYDIAILIQTAWIVATGRGAY
jgi:undecaprenyl-phosphate galactose phosphotransferase